MRKFLLLFIIITVSVCAAFGQQNLKPGNPAPNFAAQSLDGTNFNLTDLHGKVVVITFWSTRCAICHSEIPKLNQVADRYKGKDVVFIAPTMENQTKVLPYLKKNPFNFTIVPNGFGMVLKYADLDASGNINMGFPAYFLIDQDGDIVHRSHGWDKTSRLDAQITKLLAADKAEE